MAMADPFQSDVAPDFALPDDLSREVYCILGVPVDAIGMNAVLRRIGSASTARTPFLISTPNLNSLVISQLDREFREALILSDLCTADGMPIIWIAWLMGIPIKKRIAGSDIFEALKTEYSASHSLKAFLLGCAEGVAAAASRALNGQPSGLYCVGWLFPGFGSADEMSRDDIIDTINSSGADLLVASLGNQKGHLWLGRNHHRLLIPVRAHFGASLNFQAGTVRRAPLIVQKSGLEWLWRIKEEPYLWRRYWNDGAVLLRLLFTRVLPSAVWTWWGRLNERWGEEDLTITQAHDHQTVTVSLSGPATARYVNKAILAFRKAMQTNKQIRVDFSNARTVDVRFLGLLLMLNKKLKNTRGQCPVLVGLSPGLKRIFRFNNFDFT